MVPRSMGCNEQVVVLLLLLGMITDPVSPERANTGTPHAATSASQVYRPAPSQLQCAWGAGAAVPQPPPAAVGAPNFTCTPPAVVGVGHITLETKAISPTAVNDPLAAIGGAGGEVCGDTTGIYLDAQLFSYLPKPAPAVGSTGLVRVALLPMAGADGASPFNVSLAYLTEAGRLGGVDLAVLPENFAQRHVGTEGNMEPPPQPVSGPIIQAVAAVARRCVLVCGTHVPPTQGGWHTRYAVLVLSPLL